MENKIFIIEHMEPRLWKWSFIEYKNISRVVGRENVWFTNIKSGDKNLKKYGRVFMKSVKEMGLKGACILDPCANKSLTPREKDKFDYFIFGGILGDYPKRNRTGKELTKFLKNIGVRNIGKEQLSTDGAVYVVKKILEGKKLSSVTFKDEIEIKINKILSTILPFKYPAVNGKAFISKELIDYIKMKDSKF